ncbi:MAG: glycogen debranching enzyme N-terminal domain-containing protein [Bacteroidales bacterium]|nr:glycogen debranching enzyme N-terminal domain-containing protein [Bacteroidales bacterium]
MKKLKINQSKLTNYEYLSKRDIKVKNCRNALLYTNLIFSNRKREQGLFIAHLSQPSNGYYVLLASLLETLKMGDFEYHLSVSKLGDEYKTSGLKYLYRVEASPFPCLSYRLGTIDLEKCFILDPERNLLFINYQLKNAPIEVKFELDPLMAFREINKLSFANNRAKSFSQKSNSGYALNMYDDFPSLYFFSDDGLNYKENGHWVRGFEYPLDNFEAEYEDLFAPGRLSFTLKPKEEFTLVIGLEELKSKDIRTEFNRAKRSLAV